MNDEDYSETLFQRGYGINGDLTFDNCRSGISTRRVGVDIANNNMRDCVFGISATQAIGRDVEIKRNTIGCFSRGVNLLHNNVASKILVEFNIINLDDIYLSAKAIGINLAETNSAAQPNSKIKNNEVNIHNGARGIAAVGTNSTLIDDNIITATADFNIGYPYHGIDVRNSIKCDVSCNVINGNLGTTNFSAFQNKGVRIDGTTQTFVSCNTLRNHHVGMQFIGDCGSPDQIRGNEFTENFEIGLHYFDANLNDNLATITGLQNQQGNRWTGNFSSWGAFHNGGTFQAFQSQYFVSGTSNPFHPGTVNPSLWFNSSGQGDGYSCDGGECPEDEEKVKEYDKSIANDDPSLSELPAMNQHLMKRYLLRKIAANPNFATEESALQNFKVEMENTVAGNLHQLEQTIGNVLTIEETYLSDFVNLNDKIQNQREEIMAIDAQYFQAEGTEAENLLIERNQLIAILNDLQKNYQDVMANVLTARTSKIQNAENAATEFNTEQIWETNELEMLMTSLELIGNNEQSEGQIFNNLSTLSEQCVGEEGYAVYDAQSLLAYFTDDYWKDAVCETPQAQGLVGQINNSQLPQADVKMFPNPVNTSLTIQYNLSEENHTVYLQDVTGQIKSKTLLQENSGSIILNMNQYSNGFYWLVIQNDRREKIFSEKLIIVH